MFSIVKTLRTRGQRKPDREILSAEAVKGDLNLAWCSTAPDLNLNRVNDSTGTHMLPTLHDPRLISMHNFKMLFRGIERDKNGAEFVQ